MGELNRSLILKDEQLAKLDKNSNKVTANELKQENTELKDKVKETENLLEELKKSVTFRKQGLGEDDQLAEVKKEVVSQSEKDSTIAIEVENKKEVVRVAINQWVNSWSTKDVETYIASYAPEFKPSRGLSRDIWEKGRRKRLSNPTFIKITLSNVEIEFREGGVAKVFFTQEYQSDTYSDKVNKDITLKLIDNKWLIMRERVRQ